MSGAVPDDDVLWQQFLATWGEELDGWVDAERLVAAAQAGGFADAFAGDRLMVAEAALQRLIVDFAASQAGVDDPTHVALRLLRRAELLLHGPQA